MTTFSLPDFTSGNLLSAYHLNMLTEATNAIKGAVAAPSAVFVKSGVNQTYHCRRKYRYLHVRYSVFCDPGENITVKIAGAEYYHNTNQSNIWRTFDLTTQAGAPALGAWYMITILRTGTGGYLIEEVRESSSSSPTGASGTYTYTAPPTFGTGDNAATFLSKLQQLRTSILSMSEVVNTPSAIYLRGRGSLQYTMRRQQPNIAITYTCNDTIELDVYVGSASGKSKIFEENDTTRTLYTRTIAHSSYTHTPAVGEFYTLELSKTDGSFAIDDIIETGYSLATYAPTWTHGTVMSESVAIASLNNYSTVIASAYAALGVVGWQFATIYRPAAVEYNTPLWSGRKAKRYLHYMRDGSNACRLLDPSGVYDAIGLNRTTNEPNKIAVYDLDSVDWLGEGALFWIENADIVWLDDEA